MNNRTVIKIIKITRVFLLMCSSVLILDCSMPVPAAVVEIVRPVKIFTVGDAISQAVREFPGEIQAGDRAEQSIRVGGELIALPAKAGIRIKKGDLLARLDPKDYQLRLDDRQAKYDLAKVQYDRAQDPVEKKLIPIADFDKAKSQILATLSNLNLAKADLSYTELRSPMDGVVSKVFVQNHENIQAKSPVVNIQSKGSVDIEFQLPESVYARVKKQEGKKANISIKFDTHPDLSYKAVLKEYDTEADPQTKT